MYIYIYLYIYTFTETHVEKARVISQYQSTPNFTHKNSHFLYTIYEWQSVTSGPPLDANWGEGTFSKDGYRFNQGAGLMLDEAACINPKDWTIYMHVSLDTIGGYRRLIESDGWGDMGFYISNGRFMLFPPQTALQCDEQIDARAMNKFAVTRTSEGDITLYMNGYKCMDGMTDYASGFKLDPNSVWFMQDDGGENSAGLLRRIRMWNRALTPDEIAEVSGCVPYRNYGEACARSMRYNAEYKDIKYSSIWSGETVGVGHGRGRLDSPQAWSAWYNKKGEWMQIDAGKVTSIEGVITQGRAYSGQWVTAFKVAVSDDGTTWHDVECGRVFAANTNGETDKTNAFEKPMMARYVRLIVVNWNNHISMRAGLLLCEQECKNKELDYKFQDNLESSTFGPALLAQWGTGRYIPNQGYSFMPGQGLFLDEESCIPSPSIWSIIIQVSLTKVNGWNRLLMSEFWGDYGLYVGDGRYMMFPRSTKMTCNNVPIIPETKYTFALTREEGGLLKLYVNGYLCAQGTPPLKKHFELDPKDITFLRDDGSENTGGTVSRIRIFGKTLETAEIMALSGCTAPKLDDKVCDKMITLNAQNANIKYSSVWGNEPTGEGHGSGRLDSEQGWSAGYSDQNQYMQIDTGKVQPISGIITQGRRAANYRGTNRGWYGVHWQWVTRYRVEVSDDGKTWTKVQCGQEFEANVDNDSRVKRKFDKPVMARFVRINPTAWNGHPTMRAALLVCAQDCEDKRLDYPLRNEFTSTSQGPALEPVGPPGDFDTTTGDGRYCSYQNGACACTGTVKYCGGGACFSKESRDTIACTDEEFGDPKVGVAKQCFCRDRGYRYPKGSGFELEEGACVGGGKVYSILIAAVLTRADDWNRLVGCEEWGAAGMFVQANKFTMMPEDADMSCEAKIESNQLNRYAISRGEDGTVRMYLNGHLCAKGKPTEKDGFSLAKCPQITLFKDDKGRDNAGVVRRVAMWGKELTGAQMAEEAKCNPAEESKEECSDLSVRTLTYDNFKMSSILGNWPLGTYWGQSRLDSTYSWISANNRVGEWMQLDSGKVQTIAGIITQGRGDAGWWTTTYTIRVSQDGQKWFEVECGRRFAGNNDMNTKVQTLFTTALTARYVRIYPMTWVGYPSMRAGLLTCQSSCTDTRLSYDLTSGSLSSATGGPSLESPWGTNGFFGVKGMQFAGGKGLQIDGSKCIGDGKAFSVIVDIKFDALDTPVGVMTTKAWGIDGLVVRDDTYQLTPTSLTCPEKIRTRDYYKFGLTRAPGGRVVIYLNGFPCGDGQPVYHDAFTMGVDEITFLRGASESLNGRGFVKSVNLWGRVLTGEEMAKESGCVLADTVGACSRNTIRNVAYEQMRASSTYGDHQMGTGFARGQLNSPMCWVPQYFYWNDNARTQWLQLDLGKVDTVAGVVTQGCGEPGYANWFVKTFYVKVSQDGSTWRDVECGRQFEAGSDVRAKTSNLFQNPVKARFIRVSPDQFNGVPAMRVGAITCESKCEKQELDYRLKTGFSSRTGGPAIEAPWGEGVFDAVGYKSAAGQGLDIDERECIDTNKDYTVLIEVKLDAVNGWHALIGSPKWGDFGLYISDGALNLRPTELICDGEKLRVGYTYKIGMTRSEDDGVAIFLNGFKCASGKPLSASAYALAEGELGHLELLHGTGEETTAARIDRVRVWGKALTAEEMLDVSGCVPAEGAMRECSGLITVNMPYSKYSASSSWGNHPMSDGYEHGRARLNSRSAWASGKGAVGEYLQMDLGKVQKVGGVVTQGRENAWQYVSTYRVKVSISGDKWMNVECGRIFDGNNDLATKVKNLFSSPVKARYVRIYPETWYGWMSMRAGALVCESKCEDSHLDYNLDDSLTSDTDGPSLETPWGSGTFTAGGIYRFNAGQGLQLDESACVEDPKKYSILMDVQLQTMNDYRALFSAEDWSSGGLFIKDSKLVLRPSDLQCAQTLYPEYYYKIGITHTEENLVTLFINGFPCASGKATSNNGFVLSPKDMDFMYAPENQVTGGNMKRLQIWGDALSDAKMAEESDCKLTDDGTSCKGGFVNYVVPYAQTTMSSVWYWW